MSLPRPKSLKVRVKKIEQSRNGLLTLSEARNRTPFQSGRVAEWQSGRVALFVGAARDDGPGQEIPVGRRTGCRPLERIVDPAVIVSWGPTGHQQCVEFWAARLARHFPFRNSLE